MTRPVIDPPPLVLAAPSGTGKTTIAHALVDGWARFVFSVSATTRVARGGERDGIDYHFLSETEFRDRIDEEGFAEWAQVHGHLYGTPIAGLRGAAAGGLQSVLDIDVQGAAQIRERLPSATTVFVLPPSARALWERLGGRATESRTELERRLRNARGELQEAEKFDYVVVNRDLSEAVEEVLEIALRNPPPKYSIEWIRSRVRDLQIEIDQLLATEFSEPNSAPDP